jgi:hypothetical protein
MENAPWPKYFSWKCAESLYLMQFCDLGLNCIVVMVPTIQQRGELWVVFEECPALKPLVLDGRLPPETRG